MASIWRMSHCLSASGSLLGVRLLLPRAAADALAAAAPLVLTDRSFSALFSETMAPPAALTAASATAAASSSLRMGTY